MHNRFAEVQVMPFSGIIECLKTRQGVRAESMIKSRVLTALRVSKEAVETRATTGFLSGQGAFPEMSYLPGVLSHVRP